MPKLLKRREIIIVDASGSMEPRRESVVNGLKEQLSAMEAEEKSQNVKYDIEIIFFNTLVTKFKNGLYENLAKQITEKYIPQGWTALYDAVGEAISVAEAGEGNVNVTIYTDGEENRSKIWTAATVKELVRIRTEENKWGFTYFGSNQNAWKSASNLGISNAINYTDNNLKAAIGASSATRSDYNNMSRTQDFRNLNAMASCIDEDSLNTKG